MRVCLAFGVWCQWYLRAVRLVRNVRDVRNVRACAGAQRAIVSLEVRRLVRCAQCERFFSTEQIKFAFCSVAFVNLSSAKQTEQTPDPSGLSFVAIPSLDLLHEIINQLTDTPGTLTSPSCNVGIAQARLPERSATLHVSSPTDIRVPDSHEVQSSCHSLQVDIGEAP